MTTALLNALGPRHAEMTKLYRYYTADQDSLCREVFNQVLTEEQQAELNLYRLFVNLTAPSTDRFVSGVYGGVVSRTVESTSPYKDELDDILAPGRGYAQVVREWFTSAVLFGTGYLVWQVRDGRVVPYLPNPIYTKVETESWDCSKIVKLTEYSPCSKYYRVISATEYATYATEGDKLISRVEHGVGICPVVVAYGKSQTAMGNPYGVSLVRDSIKYSEVISRVQLAALQLCLTYTRPQAYLAGDIKTLTEDPEGEINEMLSPGGVAHLADGGQFGYASPNSRFEDLIKLVAYIIKQYCLTTGLPLDSLDSSTIDPNQSATAARLRNQPLKTSLQRLTEAMKTCEIMSLQVAAAVIQWLDTEQPVTFSDVQQRVRVNVSMEPAGSPESRTDEVTAWIQLLQAGIKTREECIRHFGSDLSEDEIAKRMAEHPVQTIVKPTQDVAAELVADSEQAAA